MQALLVEHGQVNYLTDYPKPVPDSGQALIRVLLAGICSTDLEIVKGYAGFSGVLGHEFVGIVEAGPEQWRGQRVVGSINLGCGSCSTCLGSGPEHCPQRTVLGIIGHDGAFADYLCLPVRNLLAVPESLADNWAVFTEPVAAALRIKEQIAVSPSARMAVIGPGRLGMLIGMTLSVGGASVVMIGRREESLRLADSLGLETGLVADLKENSFDLVIEATGNRHGLEAALRATRPLGSLVMKSTYADLSDIDLTKLVVGEIKVVGSRCGPFEPAVRLLDRQEIEVTRLIDGEYALEDGLLALEEAARPGVRKILLRP